MIFIAGLYWHYNVLKSVSSPSPVSGDFYHLYLPFYLYTSENLSRLHIPLWNPYQMCGVPYLSVLQGAVFYPPVLLFAILPPTEAYSAYIIMHIVLGAFFIILLGRHLKLSWLAAWAGAITFMFCSNTISKVYGPAFLANSIYLPLMVLFTLKIFETGRLKWAIALAMAVVLPLFAGWIQALVYSLYALCALVAAIVIRSYIKRRADELFIKRGLVLLLYSAVLFLLISALQTLPVIELGVRATRSFRGISEELLTIDNTAIYGLYRMAFDTLNSNGGLIPFYLYMGMLPLFLGVIALWHKRLRFYVLFLYGMSVCSLILSMGPQTPVFDLSLHLPMAKMFRAPFRFLFLHALAVSLLCGIGLDRFLEYFESFKTQRNKTLAATALGVAAVGILLCYVWPVPDRDQPAVITIILAASRWRIYLLALSLLVLFLAVIPRVGQCDRYVLGSGCLGLILLDLFAVKYSYLYLPRKDPQVYEKH
ncbi:MAG: YfhO family protein, partial [Candidatus Hydrogenedentota bacterium]